MGKPQSLKQFLQNIEEGEYAKIEAYNFIESITDGFKVDKLNILLEDINDTIERRRDDLIESWEKSVPHLKPQYNERGEPDSKKHYQGGQAHDLREKLNDTIKIQLTDLHDLKKLVETKIDEHSKPTPPPTQQDSSDPRTEPGIELYLNEDGLKYLHCIKKLYSHVRKKKEYITILFALGELGMLTQKPDTIGHSQYYRVLANTFGEENVGGRANISHFFNKLDQSDPSTKAEINHHKRLIQSSLD